MENEQKNYLLTNKPMRFIDLFPILKDETNVVISSKNGVEIFSGTTYHNSFKGEIKNKEKLTFADIAQLILLFVAPINQNELYIYVDYVAKESNEKSVN